VTTDRRRQAPWVVAAVLAPLSAATFAGTVAWAAPDHAAPAVPAAAPGPTRARATGDEVDARIRREAARVKRLRAEVAKLREQVADERDADETATSGRKRGGTGTSTSAHGPRTRPTSDPAPPKAPKPAPPPVDVTTGAS